MNVLSLFDGMGCAMIALDRLGIPVTNYYASEIDKHAIKVTSTKWPDVHHLGSVTDVHAKDLPKIDFLCGGSPCQGFSFAGKQLAFNDPRSALFFEFVRILRECQAVNPNLAWLLENVRMKKEHEDVISNMLGIQPININSSLVSAQNRERLYWTNIAMSQRGLFGDNYCTIPQPKDKGIVLRDILESDVPEKYYLSDKATAYITDRIRLDKRFTAINGDKSLPLMAQYDTSKNGTYLCVDGNGRVDDDKTGTVNSRYYKGVENFGSNPFILTNKQGELKPNQNKTGCFTAGGHSGGNHSDMDLLVEPVIGASRGRGEGRKQELELRSDKKTNTVTSVAKDNLVITEKRIQWAGGYEQNNRAALPSGKSGACHTSNNSAALKVLEEPFYRIRRLTPIEVCRLQTVPNDYFFHEGQQIVSDTQIYRMTGNGWTVDIITYILSHSIFNK